MMRRIGRSVLALAYLVAGILHLAIPEAFLRIVPGWVPYPHLVVLATGACEIVGAIGLMTHRLRRAAGIGLALYAVCVFPANIKHAIDDLSGLHAGLGWWYHGSRLALQPVLVWWALQAGGVFGGRSGTAHRRDGLPLTDDQGGVRPRP